MRNQSFPLQEATVRAGLPESTELQEGGTAMADRGLSMVSEGTIEAGCLALKLDQRSRPVTQKSLPSGAFHELSWSPNLQQDQDCPHYHLFSIETTISFLERKAIACMSSHVCKEILATSTIMPQHTTSMHQQQLLPAVSQNAFSTVTVYNNCSTRYQLVPGSR